MTVSFYSRLPPRGAGVSVELDGLPEEQRDAVRASLELNDYDKRDISPAELRAAYQGRRRADPPGARAFRLLRRRRSPSTSPATPTNGWKAQFDVTPGKPAIVREAHVEVRGEGKEQRRVAAAVAGFAPKVGERLDHATYEASKSVIDTSLRGAGFLDAKYTQRRVTVKPEEESADSRPAWDSGPRYKFGDVRFAGDAPFPEKFLREFVPWREDAFFNSEQVLNLQQRLVDADYFELVSVQPALDEKKDGTVPIDVLLNRDERTVYSGEVYYSTDFGAGVRVGAERRWLNKKGHKADAKVEYSQRLQEAAAALPDSAAGPRRPFLRFRRRRIATRPRTSAARAISSSPRRARRSAGTASRARIGAQISRRRFRDRPGRGQSRVRQLATVVCRRHAEPAPRQRPARAAQGLRARVRRAAGQRGASSPTPTSRRPSAGITWLLPQGERGRFKLRGEVGAMAVGNFDALAARPALLRRRRPLDSRLRLSRDRRDQRQRQHHRRQVPRRGAAPSTSTTSTRTGARRCSSTRAMPSPTSSA